MYQHLGGSFNFYIHLWLWFFFPITVFIDFQLWYLIYLYRNSYDPSCHIDVACSCHCPLGTAYPVTISLGDYFCDIPLPSGSSFNHIITNYIR